MHDCFWGEYKLNHKQEKYKLNYKQEYKSVKIRAAGETFTDFSSCEWFICFIPWRNFLSSIMEMNGPYL